MAPSSPVPRFRRSRLLGVVLAAGAVLASREAAADDADEWVPPSSRRMWYAAGLGSDIGVASCGYYHGCAHFQFINEVGYHFNGRGDGPAIGGLLILGGARNTFRFSPQAKFWWDIPVFPRHAFFLTPGLSAGYNLVQSRLWVGDIFDLREDWASNHSLIVQGTFAGRVVLRNRGLAYFQPVGLGLNLGGGGVGLAITSVLGGGFTFD
ncbi:MAG: hypothetical protein FJ096_21880 [Deltaproteobacteria bacterium]|nr:hypothetical protein [Deltaproteobacteria bacterium]